MSTERQLHIRNSFGSFDNVRDAPGAASSAASLNMYLDARSFLVQCGQFPELSARPIGDRLPGKAGCPETMFNCLVAIL
jgi:hypothetical protein